MTSRSRMMPARSRLPGASTSAWLPRLATPQRGSSYRGDTRTLPDALWRHPRQLGTIAPSSHALARLAVSAPADLWVMAAGETRMLPAATAAVSHEARAALELAPAPDRPPLWWPDERAGTASPTAPSPRSAGSEPIGHLPPPIAPGRREHASAREVLS
ncbi:hypothetical protein [Nonomuraea sp. NPDC049400]|uniref:hypothetical protein n=1 Tax=Nonomuraea sp. NPDC049400 TaxID=3364352 RepID=UPI0037928792